MTKIKRLGLLSDWKITPEELNEILVENPSMRGLVFGYIAEFKLRKMIEADNHFVYVGKPKDHDKTQKADLIISYKKQPITIEVKSLQTNSICDLGEGKYKGGFQCDASDKRTVKFEDGSELATTCLLTGEFDILAVPLFGFTGEWQYAFAQNHELPRSTHKKYSDYQRRFLLSTMMPMQYPITPPYTYNLLDVCDAIVKARASR